MLAGDRLGSEIAIACKPGGDCPSPGSSLGAVGAGLGALAAVVIDASFIARKRVTVESPAPSVAPSLGYARSGLTLGLAGSL